MGRQRILCVVTVVAALVAAIPGQVTAQRLSLADRVTKLENAANVASQGAGQANLEAQNHTVQLQAEVASLRNLVETLQHEIEQLKQTNRQQYLDLDGRLGRLEGTPSTASSPSSRAPAPAVRDTSPPSSAVREPGPAEGFVDAGPSDGPSSAGDPVLDPEPMRAADPAAEEADYQAALDTLVERFEAADSARLFQRFIADYPQSPLLPNAYYWLGESYYVTQNYELAQDAFRTLLGSYPGSRKEADALLKLGYSQIAVGDTGAGEATLRDLLSRYPGTEAAAKAESRLRTLSLENG